MIRPEEYKVTGDSIRKRLRLAPEDVIVPFGYEEILDTAVINVLKTKYDNASLFLRTQPDFFVIKNHSLFFVEAKQRVRAVEAIQLLYNKHYQKMGITVLYSFPNVTISASLIPMELVIVPQNYKDKFDVNLKYLFEKEGVTNFSYINKVERGSGDAFVPVDVEDLELLAEGEKP